MLHGERVDVGARDEDEAVVGAAAVRPQPWRARVRAVEVAAVVLVQVRVDGEDGLPVRGVRVADDDGGVLGVAGVPAVAAEVDAAGRVHHDVLPCAVVPGAGGAEGGVGGHFGGAVDVEEFEAGGDGVAVGFGDVTARVEEVFEVLGGEVEEGAVLGDLVDHARGEEGDVGAGVLDAAGEVVVEVVGGEDGVREGEDDGGLVADGVEEAGHEVTSVERGHHDEHAVALVQPVEALGSWGWLELGGSAPAGDPVVGDDDGFGKSGGSRCMQNEQRLVTRLLKVLVESIMRVAQTQQLVDAGDLKQRQRTLLHDGFHDGHLWRSGGKHRLDV